MNSLRRLATSVLVALLITIVSLPHAGAVTIDWVTVGDPGNAADTTGYGAVAEEFRVLEFEWTNSQYAQFLNAIDPEGTNPNSVYNSNMGSNARGGISFDTNASSGSKYAVRTDMGDKPVNYVTWFDAARVSNWLQNGAQAYGNTDSSASAPQNTGAYSVGTATSGSAVAKNVGALYWVPSENEWYKAAYYNPTLNSGSGGYAVYGNGFSTLPGEVSANSTGDGSAGPTGNFANCNLAADWNGQDGNVTTVGTNGAASYYGAFDMSGNVSEWNDLTGTADSFRALRGGGYSTAALNLASSNRTTSFPTTEAPTIGFRLASPIPVPEPSTCAMAIAGLACGGYSLFRRRTRS